MKRYAFQVNAIKNQIYMQLNSISCRILLKTSDITLLIFYFLNEIFANCVRIIFLIIYNRIRNGIPKALTTEHCRSPILIKSEENAQTIWEILLSGCSQLKNAVKCSILHRVICFPNNKTF